jgi:DNA invertase Pin-like site-specific DNA recombinase
MYMCIHRNDVLQIVDTARLLSVRWEANGNCDPDGKAMFTVIAALAELERSVVREGVRAALS